MLSACSRNLSELGIFFLPNLYFSLLLCTFPLNSTRLFILTLLAMIAFASEAEEMFAGFEPFE